MLIGLHRDSDMKPVEIVIFCVWFLFAAITSMLAYVYSGSLPFWPPIVNNDVLDTIYGVVPFIFVYATPFYFLTIVIKRRIK
jgi:hypothetical protein